MDLQLQDQHVLITGGSRGIGLACAQHFAKLGDKVAITYNNTKPTGDFFAVKCDVTSQEQVDAAFAEVEAKLGPVQVLVSNAGITKDLLLLRMNEVDFSSVVDANLTGAFRVCKRATQSMLRARSGRIILMSSVVGLLGSAGQANYAASKAGMNGFTKSIALELGSRNIRCNAIAPGFIETEMTAKLNEDVVKGWRDAIPLKRGGTPEDVANVCVFLASDMSAYVTGQVINVDGGMLT